MAVTVERHPGARAEMRRARIIILSGLAGWLVLAIVVQLTYGRLAALVLAGWGGSMVVCLGMTIGPLASAALRDPKPQSIGAGNTRNGAAPRRSTGSAVRHVA